MDPDRWQKLKESFYTALKLPVERREGYLQELFANDPQTHSEVSALLRAHENLGEFMASPALEQLEPMLSELTPSLEATRIGPYRILRELGRGGMGVVYLAVRDDEVARKQVAIKIIQTGDNKTISRRFRTERQALATLEHESIARFLDGGFTDDGHPYYVMEYVEGEPIDRFCDSQRLSIRQRLELFRQVCAAVHYAHQNLIVHRDLKPDNILVNSAGIPKLLDFGIAKILRPELSPHTLAVTSDRRMLLTPAYASPEQLRGTPITISSDVYSLGVMLYELLTGHRPYRFESGTPQEIERVVCEQEPEKPSTAITRVGEIKLDDGSTKSLTPEMVSLTREGRPDRLRRRLTGDLDNIVMMAMRKEPQRRYASAAQLAEDIRRHLDGMPVIARPASLAYRSKKFISRYKTGVIAATLTLILLLIGIISTYWQAQVADAHRAEAERRFNDVRTLANALIFELHDAIEDLPGATPARKLLVSRAQEYLDGLARGPGDDPSLQLELAWAYQKLGDVQGNPNNANLGDISGALQSYGKGIMLAEQVVATTPENVNALEAQATIYEKLSDVQSWSGELSAAIASGQDALRLYKKITALEPEKAKFQQSLAISHIKLGDILGNPNFPNMRDHTKALEHYQEALAIFNRLAHGDSADIVTRRHLGIIYERMGSIFEVQSELEKTLRSYQHSLQIRQELNQERPHHYDISRDLAVAYEKLARVHQVSGNSAVALQEYRRSLSIFKELLSNDPLNANAQRSVSISHQHIGDVLAMQGRISQALSSYRESLAIQESLVQGEPLNWQASSALAGTLGRLADLTFKQGETERARAYTLRLLQLQKQLANKPDARALDLNNYAWTLLSCQPESLRDATTALAYAQKAARMTNGEDANILDTLAWAYFLTGNRKLAIRTEEKALALLPSDSPMRAELQRNLQRFQRAAE